MEIEQIGKLSFHDQRKSGDFSVNALFQCYQKTQATHRTILQFFLCLMWRKKTDYKQKIINPCSKMLRLSTLLSAQPQSVYVGYMLSDKQSDTLFYCQDTAPLKRCLPTLASDKRCDNKIRTGIFIWFSPASPLEMKINATEEILDMLIQNGRSLADMTYSIEHTFHFPEEENMYLFMNMSPHTIFSFNPKTYRHPNSLGWRRRAFIRPN